MKPMTIFKAVAFPALGFIAAVFILMFASNNDVPVLKDAGVVDAGGAGYRLAYSPGGTFELLRVSARGTSIIDAASAAALEDRKPHTIKWSRLADGVMTVKVDGKQILFATDRGIRQGFGGIQITNRGGDYIVKRITIYGAN